MANAAGIIFLSREHQDPYHLDYHRQGDASDPPCPELTIWLDDETLLPEAELRETEFFYCSACTYEYELWTNIIDATGAAEFGRRAMAALALEEFLERFHPKMRKISAVAYRDVQAVRVERMRIDAQRRFNQEQEQKDLTSKTQTHVSK